MSTKAGLTARSDFALVWIHVGASENEVDPFLFEIDCAHPDVEDSELASNRVTARQASTTTVRKNIRAENALIGEPPKLQPDSRLVLKCCDLTRTVRRHQL